MGKMEQLLDEMDALIGGKAGIGETLRAMESAFDAAWGARYTAGQSGGYVWSYVIDRAHMKRLIKEVGVEDLPRRFAAYISDSEPFLEKHRHSFNLFVRNVNKYARSKDHDFELSSFKCGLHKPPCVSEQACTKLQIAERKRV